MVRVEGDPQRRSPLVRQELPIQSVYERGEDCTTTVPVHLSILGLPPEVRTDLKLISGVRDTIKTWFDDDMERYLEVLRAGGDDLAHLRGYERFHDEWSLEGRPDGNGFLRLHWMEVGGTQSIGLAHIPVVLHNRHNQQGKFYSQADIVEAACAEIMYRSSLDPDVVLMTPGKMREYGTESDVHRIDPSGGIAEVVSQAFCSDYQASMAKALLLRDFAVAYLNRLLEASGVTPR